MARTEEQNQDAGSPEKLITKSLPCENPHEVHGFVILSDLPSADPVSKSGCQHINKAIDATSVRKGILRAGGFASLKCVTCKSQSLSDFEEKDLSLCLKCGACNCDEHLVKHFEIPRSDPHTLCAKITDWSVRCHKCDINVPVESSGKLKEGINLLKQEQGKPSRVVPKMTTFDPEMTDGEAESTTQYNRNAVIPSSACSVNVLRKTTLPSPKIGQLPSPRGLMNLGNTCFMNSVLQCLAQTPFLLDVLLEIAEPGERATLNITEDGETKQMTVELDKWGPLTESLAHTLREMTRDASGVFQPSQLLDTLRKKCRTFIGYNQHDSHELLRQLLDNVKTEDIRRYQGHILAYCGLSKKAHPDEMDEKKRALAKSLNQKLTELVNIRPDQVFKGTLVSTVQCTKCHHKSEVIENFLDLSLPVSFEKVQPSTLARRKNVFNDDENRPKSSHQKKKENKAARKAKKLAKFKKRLKDDENKSAKSPSTDKKDVDESGYSSAKATSPVQNNNIQASIENSRNEILAEALSEVNSSSSSPIRNSNTNSEVENSSKTPTQASTVESSILNGPKNDVASTSSFFNNDSTPNQAVLVDNKGSPDDIEAIVNSFYDDKVGESDPFVPGTPDMRCRLENSPVAPCDGYSSSSGGSAEEKDDNYDYDLEDDDEAADGDDDGSAEEDNADDVSEDEGINATLQPTDRYDDGSIMSCLAHFTSSEILTGNNKVKCDSCTDRQNKDVGENEKKKPVYQPATKQLLINSPPPILILHLKRFQAMYTSLRKVSKPVDFPLILDIAPFCSAKCQNLLIPGQNKILYSLYGIVVHSGSLQGGHYIAYVKARKPVEKNSYRRAFLPKSANNSVQLENLTFENIERKIEEDQSSSSTWYCISDSNVSKVTSEEQVLKREAYLLFYERIF
ncbi:ubiquitin carboxyl-terminal hydrolase 16/45 isoform X2 [Planococcus citri]